MADTIPAMLEPGEYVLNRNAARAIGKKKLDKLNYEEAPRDLLGRTQEGGYNIPAGRNIFGQPTEEMGMEELMEMIMPGGGAKATLQMGKGGIRAILSSNKEDILKQLSKMRTTGKGSKKIAEAVDWQTELQKYLKQATSRRFTNPVKKQRGGSIDDYSLMDYMMPAMDKRLGPSLMKFQSGGNVPQPGDPYYYQYMQQQGQSGAPTSSSTGYGAAGQSASGTTQDPKYTGYMTSFANAPTGAQPEPSAQSLLAQPSGSMSTGIESIFQEAGYETPGADYLEGLQAYDPTKQQRLQEDYSRKLSGPVGGAGGFAGSGAATREAGEQRELVTGQYQRGAEDLRTQYREDIMAQIAEDIASGTYEFDELG